MAEESKGTRLFYCPAPVILAAIHDLVALQKGDVTFVDKANGKISFTVEMHDFIWEYRFTVEKKGSRESFVTLEVGGRDAKNPTVKVFRQLALLDSILPIGNGIDTSGTDPPER